MSKKKMTYEEARAIRIYFADQFAIAKIKYGELFDQIFKKGMDDFRCRAIGFDIVAFDKFVAPEENESLNAAVRRRYGEKAVQLVIDILAIKPHPAV